MSTFEDFLTQKIEEVVKKAVKEAMADLDQVIRNTQRPEFITTDQLMKYTGWSRRTCQYMRDERRIPFWQEGRKILYPTDKIFQFSMKISSNLAGKRIHSI